MKNTDASNLTEVVDLEGNRWDLNTVERFLTDKLVFTKKSRKPYICAFGCEISIGTPYVRARVFEGHCMSNVYASFAICTIHLEEDFDYQNIATLNDLLDRIAQRTRT